MTIDCQELHDRIAEASPKPAGFVTIRTLARRVFVNWHSDLSLECQEAIVRRGVEFTVARHRGREFQPIEIDDSGAVVTPRPAGVPPCPDRLWATLPGGPPPPPRGPEHRGKLYRAADCAIRATATATGMTYEAVAAKLGRPTRIGLPRTRFQRYLYDLGWRFTLASCCVRDLPKVERLIVELAAFSHVVAVINGVAQDESTQGGAARVRGYWTRAAIGRSD